MVTGNYAAGVPEVAARINRGQWAVREMVRRGLIPHRRLVPGGRIEFDLAEIDEWLESRRVRPPERASA